MILLAVTLVGVVIYVFYRNFFTKVSNPAFSVSTPVPSPNSGDKLFNSLYEDPKYGFSFILPNYFGRYGSWSSDHDWEKDSNPDRLNILPLENTKSEDASFKWDDVNGWGFMLKEINISINKGTTIAKWHGKVRSVFNSAVDGWGEDHKFIKIEKTQTQHDPKLEVVKFIYYDLAAIPETEEDFDTSEPVMGIAIQKDTYIMIISMKYRAESESEVDDLFNQTPAAGTTAGGTHLQGGCSS